MWLFTRYGMFSCVLKRKGQFEVRARSKKHLQALLKRFGWPFKIVETVNADYRWRVVVPQGIFSEAVAELVSEIEWSNFKDECHGIDPEYDRALMATWTTMHRMQTANVTA